MTKSSHSGFTHTPSLALRRARAKGTKPTLVCGFTLIEVIVATGVFLVVVVIAVGALLSLIDANRKALAQKAVINNVHFAVDQMVREIRVGTTYHCGGGSFSGPADCLAGDDFFVFERSGGDPSTTEDQIIYRKNGTGIEISYDGGATFASLTAPDVIIDTLQFVVSGSLGSDTLQPRVLLIVQGRAGTGKTETDFDVQTIITQRIPD